MQLVELSEHSRQDGSQPEHLSVSSKYDEGHSVKH